MEVDVSQSRSTDRVDTRHHRIRTLRRSALRAGRARGGQSGFSMVELMTVLIIAGLIISTTVIAYYQTTRKTDQRAAAEILKTDIRKVYSLADSGAGVVDTVTNVRHRDKYRIVFHTNDENYTPVNCYKILKSSYNTGTGLYPDWTSGDVEVIADREAAVKIINNTWLKPSVSGNVEITQVTNMSGADGEKGITFESKGSIIQTDAPAGDKTITLRNKDGGASITITVSMYGSISE